MRRSTRSILRSVVCLVALGAVCATTRVAADPVPGFMENWPGTSTQGWGGGTPVSNPGTDGVFGSGDGYLLLSSPADGHFGTRSLGPEYAGDWRNAIGLIYVRLRDVGAPDDLELHVAIGNTSNLWQFNAGFVPTDAWQTFIVTLQNPADFTQIIGTGSFDEALQFVDRLLIRHDHAPFVRDPDPTHGDLGIDALELGSPPLPVRPVSWGSLKGRYRD